MDKNSDARFEAMMEHYRNEMLRYQRATPPGEETLTEKLTRAEQTHSTDKACHNCMTGESLPTVKQRPLPPPEEEEPPKEEWAKEETVTETKIEEAEIEEPAAEEEIEAVETILPIRWQIFFPDRPRPRPIPPMPSPPRPQPPRPQPPRPQPPRPEPPRPQPPRPQPPRPQSPRPQPPRPQPREMTADREFLESASAVAVNAAGRLFDTPESDFDTLVFTLADKFSSLDEPTLTRVLSVISRNDPDLASAVSLAMKR